MAAALGTLLVGAAFGVLLFGGFALYSHPMPFWACEAGGVVVAFVGAWVLTPSGRRRRRWAR